MDGTRLPGLIVGPLQYFWDWEGEMVVRTFFALFLITIGAEVANSPSCFAQRQPARLASTLQSPIVTYHYDDLRTGWNSTEYILTVDRVKQSNFGRKVVLLDEPDDQVD